MGMWIIDENKRFYREGHKLFNGPDKKIEYDLETRKPLEFKKPIDPEPPMREEKTLTLGASRQELENATIQQIYKDFNLHPRAGYTKAKLIDEILGVTE